MRRGVLFLCFWLASASRLGQPRQSLSSRISLHVVTYADHATPQLCASARSAARQRIRLRVLDATGLKLKLSDPRAIKPIAMQRFLMHDKRLKDDDLVLFADAYDVLYTALLNSGAIVDLMEAVTDRPWNSTVLFSAERNCSPYMDFFGTNETRPGGAKECARLASGTHTSFKYINSGSWVASVAMARQFLAAWVGELERDGVSASDQECVHKLRDRLPVFIDQDCKLFQTGWGTPLEGTKTFFRRRPWRSWVLSNCTVHNTETGTHPSVIHFNGDKRNFMPAATYCDGLDPTPPTTTAILRALTRHSPILEACP